MCQASTPSKIVILALACMLASMVGSTALAGENAKGPAPPSAEAAKSDQPSVDESARDARPRTRLRTEAPLQQAGPSGHPLVTRALVRQQIEAIDPAGWLARFGQVERRPLD